ncbi:MAG TPA: NUDIX domain-containing protein [Candidatus Saccharimonas sp.]|nr:NUDIX domain-containing protein [Candidatus Saccharimonas sp.]
MQALNSHLLSEIAADVAAVLPFDDLERAHQADVLQWLTSGANIFRIKKPDVPPKHLVSYFVLVDPDKRSILLVDHIKAQLWLPPGGHVKFNEHPKAAVIREAQEEFSMPATFLRGNGKPFFITVNQTGGLTPGHTDVSLWYLLRGNTHDFLQYDKSEFLDTEWYTFDEILQSDPIIFDRHLPRFINKLKTIF